MIVFDLRCGMGHVFEAWFASSSAYADQRAAGLIGCPVCGDASVDKAVMAPRVAAKGNQRSVPTDPAAQPPIAERRMREALAAVADIQARMLEKSQWVGTSFAARARAMHHGEEAAAPIHGQTSRAEAESLIDEGVAVAPLLVPIVPPEELN